MLSRGWYDLGSHEFHEVGELDDTLAFAIHVGDHLLDLLLLGLEAEGPHSDLEFLSVDIA